MRGHSRRKVVHPISSRRFAHFFLRCASLPHRLLTFGAGEDFSKFESEHFVSTVCSLPKIGPESEVLLVNFLEAKSRIIIGLRIFSCVTKMVHVISSRRFAHFCLKCASLPHHCDDQQLITFYVELSSVSYLVLASCGFASRVARLLSSYHRSRD